MGWSVELGSTDVVVPPRAGWQAPKGTLTRLYVIAAVVAVIIVVSLGSLTVATRSPAIALFALSELALGGVGIGILAAKARATRPLVVRVAATTDTVTFDAGDGTRPLLRSLAPIGVVMLVSLIALLIRGELYGESGEAVFSGVRRSGSVVFFAVSVLVIPPSIRAWRGSTGAALVLSREGITLSVPRTGGSAAWASIGGASFASERATVLASTRSFSWASLDLASDPVVLTDLIRYYAENPAARTTIGSGTMELLHSGRF